MKCLLTLFIGIIMSTVAWGQAEEPDPIGSGEDVICYIQFTYDANGCRIKRELLCENISGVSSMSALLESADSAVDSNSLVSFVFPNPTVDHFYVQLSEDVGRVEIHLLDVHGRILLSTTLEGVSQRIELAQLSAGSYFVVLHTSDKVISHKLMIAN